MVSLVALWLPVVLAAVLVFVVSSIVHMVLPYHRHDKKGLPDEEAARAALGKQDLAPGQYGIPYVSDMKQMKDPAFVRKLEEGPVAFLTVLPKGQCKMWKNLVQWFVYSIALSVCVAYLAGRALPPGTAYLLVFRVTGTAAWLGYSGAVVADGIWQGQPWSTVWKHVFDGLLYGLVTAGAFASMWPNS